MTKIKISVDNLTSANGVYMAPIWTGIHDGTFDFYDNGTAASSSLETLAEDGSASGLSSDFSSNVPSGTDGVILGTNGVNGPIDSGETASLMLDINDESVNRYFSYAGMLIPSNDAFVGNDDAQSIELFDANGDFLGAKEFVVKGADVKDAGTEVNTELDAAFINQTAPNTGVDENGVVGTHVGFIDSVGNPGGTPIILGGTNAAGGFIDPVAADFTQPDFELLKFHINVVNEINGTDEDDTITGDSADDIVEGGDGDDIIFGRDGYDELHGQDGKDFINGGQGNDIITGGDGKDHLFGNAGDDHISGDDGHDLLFGAKGNDILIGGDGHDIVIGGEGDDFLYGNDGHDDLIGGKGIDTLFGGDGKDNFYHVLNDGTTIIADFENGKDLIHLDIDGVTNLDELLSIADSAIIEEDYALVNIDANNHLEVYSDGFLQDSDFYFA